MQVDQRYLRSYLSDHLALSAGIGALARRTSSAKRWREHHSMLAAVADALREDLEDLEAVARAREIREDPLKRRLAVVGERLGRMKGNGRLVRASPLARLVELEGLQLGLAGCMAPWRTLRALEIEVERAEAALDRLRRHATEVDRLHARVAGSAFSDS